MMMMMEGADRLCVCLESVGQIERGWKGDG